MVGCALHAPDYFWLLCFGRMANIQTHAGHRQRMQKMILGNKVDIEERAVREEEKRPSPAAREPAWALCHRFATALPPPGTNPVLIVVGQGGRRVVSRSGSVGRSSPLGETTCLVLCSVMKRPKQ